MFRVCEQWNSPLQATLGIVQCDLSSIHYVGVISVEMYHSEGRRYACDILNGETESVAGRQIVAPVA